MANETLGQLRNRILEIAPAAGITLDDETLELIEQGDNIDLTIVERELRAVSEGKPYALSQYGETSFGLTRVYPEGRIVWDVGLSYTGVGSYLTFYQRGGEYYLSQLHPRGRFKDTEFVLYNFEDQGVHPPVIVAKRWIDGTIGRHKLDMRHKESDSGFIPQTVLFDFGYKLTGVWGSASAPGDRINIDLVNRVASFEYNNPHRDGEILEINNKEFLTLNEYSGEDRRNAVKISIVEDEEEYIITLEIASATDLDDGDVYVCDCHVPKASKLPVGFTPTPFKDIHSVTLDEAGRFDEVEAALQKEIVDNYQVVWSKRTKRTPVVL